MDSCPAHKVGKSKIPPGFLVAGGRRMAYNIDKKGGPGRPDAPPRLRRSRQKNAKKKENQP